MGALNDLHGMTVFFDSAPLVYYVEEVERYLGVLDTIFDLFQNGSIRVATSSLTFVEVMVVPIREHRNDLYDKYKWLAGKSSKVTVYNLDIQIAETAARIRAQHGLKTPDAIQWATAQVRGADFFLTNDRQFKKLAGPQILFLEDMVSKQ